VTLTVEMRQVPVCIHPFDAYTKTPPVPGTVSSLQVQLAGFSPCDSGAR